MIESFIRKVGSSEAEGPKSVILSGVHGNERPGIEAFEKVLSGIQIDVGIVWFGFGNSQAIRKSVRYTETDLNRMFKPVELLSPSERNSYEYRLAQQIKKYLNQADVLL